MTGAAAIVAALTRSMVGLSWVDVPSTMALVLLLPGVAAVNAFAGGRTVESGYERAFWVVLGSLGVTCLGGLALNLLGGLTEASWTTFLGSISVALSAVWWWRRSSGHHGPGVTGPPRSWWSQRGVLAGLVTGCLLSAALGVSVLSDHLMAQERFVQLWLLPRPGSAGAYAQSAELGLTNYEGHSSRFEVVVRLGQRVVFKRVVKLPQGGTYTHTLARPGQQRLSASVSHAASASRPLATAYLATPVS